MIERIVREAERRSITGVSGTTAWRLERKGLFPQRVSLIPGKNLTGWKLSELLEWVASRERVVLKPQPSTGDRAATAAQQH